ncbi:MAG: phosphatase PAP2 family protein [Bdellovibrionaceae bacterium]|nr:phosphatase PAP2 family protein [Bdellovibrio sp.]
MMEWLLQIDYWVFEKINHAGTFNWGDAFFPWITDLNKSIWFSLPVFALLLFVFYRKFAKRGLLYFLMLIISIAFNDFVGAQVKHYYTRPRPFENQEIMAIQRSPAGKNSFYSNHTSNMVTFATFTSHFFPALTIPLYLTAAFVAYSRIYNGVHYPSDVAVGALAGLFWGLVFIWLTLKLRQKYFPYKDAL